MFLRLLALLLIVANIVYFVWSQGVLRVYGFAPQAQTEPQRMAQQISPESIQLLSSQELKRAEAQAQADQAPRECWLAGPVDDARKAALSSQLEAVVPAGSWQWEELQVPARWIIYMGKFANTEAQRKKRGELEALHLSAESLADGQWGPGLSLGSFETQDQANAELARLSARGVHTARVVEFRPASHGNLLRLPAVDAVLRDKLAGLKSELEGSSPLHACN